jgi:hypothetical protein
MASTLTFKLVTEDGTPADPSTFKTVAPLWRVGDTIALGARTLRVVDVHVGDDTPLFHEWFRWKTILPRSFRTIAADLETPATYPCRSTLLQRTIPPAVLDQLQTMPWCVSEWKIRLSFSGAKAPEWSGWFLTNNLRVLIPGLKTTTMRLPTATPRPLSVASRQTAPPARYVRGQLQVMPASV